MWLFIPMASGTVFIPDSILALISSGLMAIKRAPSPGLCSMSSLGSIGMCTMTSSPFELARFDIFPESLMLGMTAIVTWPPTSRSSLSFLMSGPMSSIIMASRGLTGGFTIVSGTGSGSGASGGATGSGASWLAHGRLRRLYWRSSLPRSADVHEKKQTPRPLRRQIQAPKGATKAMNLFFS